MRKFIIQTKGAFNDQWHDCCEGPWETEDAAVEFGLSEMGVPYRVVEVLFSEDRRNQKVIQDYLDAQRKFSEATADFTKACRNVRGHFGNNKKFKTAINGVPCTISTDDQGDFDIQFADFDE